QARGGPGRPHPASIARSQAATRRCRDEHAVRRAVCRLPPRLATGNRGGERGVQARSPRLATPGARPHPQLERVFHFPSFADALAFTNQIGTLAEAEGHHPALLTEWGRVTVTWWTHKIRGLHRNDFIMAAKTDALRLKVDALPE